MVKEFFNASIIEKIYNASVLNDFIPSSLSTKIIAHDYGQVDKEYSLSHQGRNMDLGIISKYNETEINFRIILDRYKYDYLCEVKYYVFRSVAGKTASVSFGGEDYRFTKKDKGFFSSEYEINTSKGGEITAEKISENLSIFLAGCWKEFKKIKNLDN